MAVGAMGLARNQENRFLFNPLTGINRSNAEMHGVGTRRRRSVRDLQSYHDPARLRGIDFEFGL